MITLKIKFVIKLDFLEKIWAFLKKLLIGFIKIIANKMSTKYKKYRGLINLIIAEVVPSASPISDNMPTDGIAEK